MTMVPCQRCGEHLMRDTSAMCPQCEVAAKKQPGAVSRSLKWIRAAIVFFWDIILAFSPVWKAAGTQFQKHPVTWLVAAGLLMIVISGITQNFAPPTSSGATPTPPPPQSVSKPQPAETQKKVYNSSWDGSVWQVEHYLDRVLKDPDSFDAIEWSPVVEIGYGYSVRCRYRAKNSFGGYVIEEKVFTMNAHGDVIGVEDWR